MPKDKHDFEWYSFNNWTYIYNRHTTGSHYFFSWAMTGQGLAVYKATWTGVAFQLVNKNNKMTGRSFYSSLVLVIQHKLVFVTQLQNNSILIILPHLLWVRIRCISCHITNPTAHPCHQLLSHVHSMRAELGDPGGFYTSLWSKAPCTRCVAVNNIHGGKYINVKI